MRDKYSNQLFIENFIHLIYESIKDCDNDLLIKESEEILEELKTISSQLTNLESKLHSIQSMIKA